MLLSFPSFLHLGFADVLDILLVAAVIYVVFRWIRGSSAMNIFIAIILLLIVRVLAVAMGLKMISTLLGTIIDVGAVAIIVIFQPEIRKFLDNLGRSAGSTIERRSLFEKLLPHKDQGGLSGNSVGEIAEACRVMSEQKTGALIVLLGRNPLGDIIATGDMVDASISSRLIMNIFFKNSPLHDGAMVVGGDRIVAARCTLPISDRRNLPARFGMRHKAAVGITEISDASVVVVSEQTGGISFVRDGVVTKVENVLSLKLLLQGSEAKTQR